MSGPVYVTKVIAFGYLKLVISYRERKYAIVRHVRCHGDLDKNNSAAPLYVTKTISQTWSNPVQRSDLARLTRAARTSASVEKGEMVELSRRMKALCFQLGFSHFTLKCVSGSNYEHFISEKSGIVGIPVVYELTVSEDFPRYSLADAFGRRGYMFVPLEPRGQDDFLHLVYRNVAEMLDIWKSDPPLMQLGDGDFFKQIKGLVCSLDVSGYARLLKDSQGSVAEGGNTVRDRIRWQVVRLTSRLLWRLKLPPHQITGDGALICLPSESANLANLVAAYKDEVCGPLKDWNDKIASGEATGSLTGSRLVVLHDTFHFGRIAGADSVMPGIGGQALIDAVRLDAGFKEFFNSKGLETNGNCGHYIVSPVSFAQISGQETDISTEFDYTTKEKQQLRGRYTQVTV